MRQKILIVANEAETLELAVLALTDKGYEVITAAAGLEAFRQARACLPDLILVDTVLPDIDGAAVCDIFHRLPSTSHAPLILLCGWPEQFANADRAAVGIAVLMGKPFTPDELVQQVKACLSRRREWNAGEDDFGAPEPEIGASWH